MAKATKVKRKDVSIHSRAARRATSPSIDTDKALKNAERPDADGGYTFSGSYAGIEKKKKQKKMTRQQRLRLEKGMERAEQNTDKLIKKREDSHVREKKVKTRNIAWEELNEKVLNTVSAANAQPSNRFAAAALADDQEDAGSDEDVPITTQTAVDTSVTEDIDDEVL